MFKRYADVEILSPAGNFKQAEMAIYGGCDAVYGGLKNWNARNRAVNFTNDEYCQLLAFCHAQNVKFYLTLNTLLLDEELEAVEKLLSCEHVPLPDAFIVTDVGLISVLRKSFPQVDLHISTQGGVASVEDALFYQDMGATRVILARELRLPEIKTICKNTNLEIETFIFGSQCVAFSGQCLWGGLLHGCSGNRGRCIGMCRDIYINDTKLGNFLYPRDINGISQLAGLRAAGVRSIKIEGRMRSPYEIFEITRNLRSALDGHQQTWSDPYAGYMEDKYPPPSMFHLVNPRVTPVRGRCVRPQINDLSVAEDHITNKRSYFFGSPPSGSESFFVKSIFAKPFSDTLPNVALKAIFGNGNELIGLDYITTYGERRKLNMNIAPDTTLSVSALQDIIQGAISANVYEFTCSIPSAEQVLVNIKELHEMLKHLSFDIISVHRERVIFNYKEDIFSVPSYEHFKLMYSYGARKFIVLYEDDALLQKLLHSYGDIEIYWKIPPVSFRFPVKNIVRTLIMNNQKIFISRLPQICLLSDYSYHNIILGYGANIWNSSCLNTLSKMGINNIVISPEIKLETYERMLNSCKFNPYIIYFGRIPIALTRGCFKEVGICNRHCNSNSSHLVNYTKDYTLSIYCNKKYDYREIVPEQIFFAGNNLFSARKCIFFDYIDINLAKSLLEEESHKSLFFTQNIYS